MPITSIWKNDGFLCWTSGPIKSYSISEKDNLAIFLIIRIFELRDDLYETPHNMSGHNDYIFIIIPLSWYSTLCIHRCNYKIKDSQFHENSICVLLIFSSMEKQISILHCWWGHDMENFSAFQWVPFRKGPLCRYWCLCDVSPNELLNKYSSGRRSRDITVIAWYIPTGPQVPNKKNLRSSGRTEQIMHMVPGSSSISHWPVGWQRGQYYKMVDHNYGDP